MSKLKAALGIVVVLILSLTLQIADAEQLELFTDNKVYSDNLPLFVYGKSLSNEQIIIRLFAPDGTISKFDQILTDSGGLFNHVLLIWPKVSTSFPYGTYTVEAISMKQNGLSQKVDIKFTSSSELVEVPVERNVNTMVFAPETAAVSNSFTVFVQTTSDGLLVGGPPEKLLGTSHVHLPLGAVESLSTSFSTLHQGLYFIDYLPPTEGTYVFHLVSFVEGTISHGSAATVVLTQDIGGISNQILQLNSILNEASDELDTLKSEISSFGSILEDSQKSLTEANERVDESVSSISSSVSNIEDASGQLNSLFLPIVALIGIIVALQITILARRR